MLIRLPANPLFMGYAVGSTPADGSIKNSLSCNQTLDSYIIVP